MMQLIDLAPIVGIVLFFLVVWSLADHPGGKRKRNDKPTTAPPETCAGPWGWRWRSWQPWLDTLWWIGPE